MDRCKHCGHPVALHHDGGCSTPVQIGLRGWSWNGWCQCPGVIALKPKTKEAR